MAEASVFRGERPRPAAVRDHPNAGWFAVATVCFGAFMGQLDASIVTLTFPALQHEFGRPLAAVQWVSLAYLLGLVGLLAAAGRVADAAGRKRMYLWGFAVFTLASVACGTAPGLGWLVGFRVVQAAGAAMLQANSVALVVGSVPRERMRAALGVQAAAQALGLALGPAVGGLLVAAGGWRWVFLVNAPVGLVGWLSGRYLLPRTRRRTELARFDGAGLSLLVVSSTTLLLALSAVSASVQARRAVPGRRLWANTLSPVGFVAFGGVLFYQTLFHIDRNAWAVAYDVVSLVYLLITLATMQSEDARDTRFFGFIGVLASIFVAAAMLLRLVGPPGVMTILDLIDILFPAVLSLILAGVGTAITWWATRVVSRFFWSVGVSLMIIAALKLVLFDFGSLGQIANILAMLAAGGLFLLVAWLAPFPPKSSGPSEHTSATVPRAAGGPRSRCRCRGSSSAAPRSGSGARRSRPARSSRRGRPWRPRPGAAAPRGPSGPRGRPRGGRGRRTASASAGRC